MMITSDSILTISDVWTRAYNSLSFDLHESKVYIARE